ncbi:hypothetical protein ACH5RR_001212 [Cinchona calisaya]|uniref:Uncharacterized protein n=1 Tax=Cinchona calisaya TaxID=153742 RepID=A0ABD3B3C8_9GENT
MMECNGIDGRELPAHKSDDSLVPVAYNRNDSRYIASSPEPVYRSTPVAQTHFGPIAIYVRTAPREVDPVSNQVFDQGTGEFPTTAVRVPGLCARNSPVEANELTSKSPDDGNSDEIRHF